MGIKYFLRIIRVLVAFQKIAFVAVVYHGVFSPHVNALYVGKFLFQLGDDFVAKAIEFAFAAKRNVSVPSFLIKFLISFFKLHTKSAVSCISLCPIKQQLDFNFLSVILSLPFCRYTVYLYSTLYHI